MTATLVETIETPADRVCPLLTAEREWTCGVTGTRTCPTDVEQTRLCPKC